MTIIRIIMGIASIALFGAMMYGLKLFILYVVTDRQDFQYGALFGGGLMLFFFALGSWLDRRQRSS